MLKPESAPRRPLLLPVVCGAFKNASTPDKSFIAVTRSALAFLVLEKAIISPTFKLASVWSGTVRAFRQFRRRRRAYRRPVAFRSARFVRRFDLLVDLAGELQKEAAYRRHRFETPQIFAPFLLEIALTPNFVRPLP